MKSYKLIQKAFLFVCSFVVLSCSQEEEYTAPDMAMNYFDINVVDAGVNSNDPLSRAVTDGEFKTTFSKEDKIGLFAVKNNTVLDGLNNLCLTYDGSKWTVSGGTNLPYTEEQASADYYIYYPYSESLTSAFAPAETDPFANIVSAWTVGEDQEGDNYTNKDLMTSGATTASGSGQKFALDFTLSHRMSLVVVELPAVSYNFTNTGMSSYSVQASGISFEIASAPVKPFFDATNGYYRLLVKPETAVTINGKFTSGTEKKYDIEIVDGGLPKGTYAYFTIDGGGSSSTPVNHTLQVGDYYCADGSLVSKDEAAPANAIGIVYYVGTTDAIKADYPSCNHGLVYALKRVAGDAIKWGVGKPVQEDPEWFVAYGLNEKYAASVIQGYEDTKIWMSIETGDVQDMDVNSYMKATLDSYRQSVSLPSSTTGWYIPSYKELAALNENATLLNAKLSAASGEALWLDATSDGISYWTSTVRRRDAVVSYHPDAPTTAGYINNKTGYYRFSFGF